MAFRTLTTTLLRLGPLNRRLLLIAADALLLPLAVWLSFWLRFANPFPPALVLRWWLLPAVVLVGLPLYALSGQYKGLTRYVGSLALYRLAGRNALLVLLLALTGVLLRLPLPRRSSWLLVWVLLTGFTGAVRFASRCVMCCSACRTSRTMRSPAWRSVAPRHQRRADPAAAAAARAGL
jgi:FlaA1/EpsC-like NDP-sugar epimerase